MSPQRSAFSRSALLDRAIQDLVRRFVAPSLVTLGSACGSDDPLDPYAPDLAAEGSGFDPIHCTGDGTWDPMPYLKPDEPHTFQALRSGTHTIDNMPTSGSTVSEHGVACDDATDPASCMQTVFAVPERIDLRQCIQLCISEWVVTSDGDDVRHWASRDALLQFLGPIDSAEDALLVAQVDGYTLGHAVDGDRCETAAVREVEDGYEIYATRATSTCAPVITTRYLLHVSRSGVLKVRQSSTASRNDDVCVGRRPEGLCAAPQGISAADELGAFLAASAHLEGAAVHAFDRMLEELSVHGAPRTLRAQARRARADEVRHAALVGALAERRGAHVPEVRVERSPVRSLLQMALENVVEGCVRETWGAVVGSYQAARAGDPELAALMRELAFDERRHAALSLELADWLDTRLDSCERAEVARVRHAALEQLRLEVGCAPSEALRVPAGLPDATTASAMLAALEAALAGMS